MAVGLARYCAGEEDAAAVPGSMMTVRVGVEVVSAVVVLVAVFVVVLVASVVVAAVVHITGEAEIVMLSAVWRVVTVLSLAASIMSLVLLFKLGFDVNFVAPLNLMVEYYRWFVEILLGRTDPYLRIVLKYLSDRFAVHLHLYLHWKYIFVPMFLYFSADAKTVWAAGRKPTALFSIAWGGLVALAASVASATMPLDAQSILPMIFSALGFVVYSSIQAVWSATFHTPKGYTRWRIFSYYWIAFALGNALIAAIIILVGNQARQLGLSSLSLALLVIFVIAIALRNIVVSIWIATFDRAEGQRWIKRFHELDTQRHGFYILITVGGAALFFAFNAGPQLAGRDPLSGAIFLLTLSGLVAFNYAKRKRAANR